MVVANTKIGITKSFDLQNPSDSLSLQQLIVSKSVTALAILRTGVQHSLSLPKGFRNSSFGAELISNGNCAVGERIFVQVDDTRIIVSSTFSGSVVRSDLIRTGECRYMPRLKECYSR